jgi:hypothetical protein
MSLFESKQQSHDRASRQGQIDANKEGFLGGVLHDIGDITRLAVPIPESEEENIYERAYHHERRQTSYRSLHQSSSSGEESSSPSSSESEGISDSFEDCQDYEDEEDYEEYEENDEEESPRVSSAVKRGGGSFLGKLLGAGLILGAAALIVGAMLSDEDKT